MSLYTYKCWIDRVVDGDTLIVDIDLGFHTKVKKSVRLLGYNAPELTRAHARTDTEVFFGKAARDMLVSLTSERFEWFIKTELDKGDKYGRVLGTLLHALDADDLSLNGIMKGDTDKMWYQIRVAHPDVYTEGRDG